MDSNYNIQLVRKQELKKEKKTRTHFQIKKKGDKMIDIKDVQLIYNQFLAKGISAERIGLVGLNGERYYTIKAPLTEDFDILEDDYLDGKSSAVKEKLSKFSSLQLIIY